MHTPTDPSRIVPPTWPLKLLRFFLKKEFIEEIEGDMEELFYENVKTESIAKAKWRYTWDAIKLLRPSLMRNWKWFSTFNHLPMMQNYFKTSSRSLLRNPLNSFINVFGLAMAIGFCILGYAFARWTINTDQFHENKNSVYLITYKAQRNNGLQEYGKSPRPLGELMQQDFPQVKRMCRVEDEPVVVKYQDLVFHERVRYADASFLEMFTFPMKWGSAISLKDINSIILNEEMSKKYFGDSNPIGETILLKFGSSKSKAFKVSGVAAKFPDAHTIDFNCLIHFDNIRTLQDNYRVDDWSKTVSATFVQVEQPGDIAAMQLRMDKYKEAQNKTVEPDWAIAEFGFQPLASLHIQSENIQDHISASSEDNYSSIMFQIAIGLVMLILACLNYVNIAIVSAAKRLKEIGVRKTIGATRTVMIVQFLTENVVITSVALVIGLGLGILFFIPWMEGMFHFSMEFSWTDPTLWIYLPAILFFTGILSGIYPAFYISRFEVVTILKGTLQFGKRNPLTKVFLGLQIVLALLLITSAVLFTQNSDYVSKRSWGYNQHQAMYVAVPNYAGFDKLRATVSEDPDVLSVAGSAQHLGRGNVTTIVRLGTRNEPVDELAVDAHYLETMGIQVLQGRNFKDQSESDKRSVIVNELFAQTMNLSEPVGATIKIDSVSFDIIGVAKDFHSYSFFEKLKPSIFRVADSSAYRYLAMKIAPRQEREAYQRVQAEWAALYPEVPFAGGYQEDVWGNYYTTMNNHAQFWNVIALMAIVLASLGLYGLITLNVSGRIREFSIRKVMGAGAGSLSFTISKNYILLIVISIAISAPLTYQLMIAMFDFAYSYHMPITFTSVLIGIAILVIVLLATISTQIRKVIKANPVKGLKVE
ncbi:MAG: FtsX-like permease family protein [Cyclobacteriaceae bacterium]|nr:FtsX-like permease family protein [Cyclobacteriaceae bacterium]